MNKEKTYIMIGAVLIQCGACMIHFGLGIILLGAWFLIGSYFEFEKSIDDDDIKDLNEAAKHYLYNNILYDDVYVGNPTDEDCIEMFKAGANWQKRHAKFKTPNIPKMEDISVSSRLQYIDEELKPIADFVIDYADWNLHKDEWNHPVLEVPLFRVLDALIQRGKPYCGTI